MIENLFVKREKIKVIMSFGWTYFKEMTKREILNRWRKLLCVKSKREECQGEEPLCKGEFFLKKFCKIYNENLFEFYLKMGILFYGKTDLHFVQNGLRIL